MNNIPTPTQLLHGHTSPETAYLIPSYPYGFRLRCQIRYWIESNKRGSRFVSQTSNPKKPGLVWNKPKAGTYSMVMAMYLDENGHVQHSSLNEYRDTTECIAWRDAYRDALSEGDRKMVDVWISMKEDLDAKRGPFKALESPVSLSRAPESGEGSYEAPVRYNDLTGTREEMKAQSAGQWEKAEADVKAGKVICLSDLIGNAERLHTT